MRLTLRRSPLHFGGLRFPGFNGKRGLIIGLTVDFAVERGDHLIPVKPCEHMQACRAPQRTQRRASRY